MEITPLRKYLTRLLIVRGEELKDMADKVGVTTSYLQDVEQGKIKISKRVLRNIVSKYNLSHNEQKELNDVCLYSGQPTLDQNLTNKSEPLKELAIEIRIKFNTDE